MKFITWLTCYRHQTPLAWVFVLAMATLLTIQVPSIAADQPKYFRYLHADQCGGGRPHPLPDGQPQFDPIAEPVSGQIEYRPKRWILLQERRSGLEWLYDQSFSQVSAPGRIRTRDPLLRRQLLCPAELRALET